MQPYPGVDKVTLLTTAMRVAQDNHRIIANNIANVDTPRYNPVELDFKQTLRNALGGRGRISLRRTRSRHIEARRAHAALESVVILSKNDYNKVDVDKEIANLSKNTGRYNVYGSLLVKHFQTLKSVITNAR